jgi:alkaline phosphatase
LRHSDCPDDPSSGAACEPHHRHVILFIGDGMPLVTEIAASRYLTGTTDGLSFHQLPYRNSMTTWDVTTYDRYAWAQGAERFDPDDFEPTLGYDPERGGRAPYPHAEVPDPDYFLQQLPTWPTAELAPARAAPDAASAGTALATGVKTDRGNVAWGPGDTSGGQAQTFSEWARQNYGFSIGLVSTTPFSHAAAATFVAHNVSAENISPNQKQA